MGDCFICDKHAGIMKTAGSTIFEDDFISIGHIDGNGNPVYLGHLVIDLKRHAPGLGDMNPAEASAFGVAMSKVSRALMEVEKAEHIYSFVTGHAVPHLHMHIVPRYPGTPEKYWGPSAVYDWEEAPMRNISDVQSLCDRLKKYMDTHQHA
nr:HIT family protein [Jeotgalibacillus terrae]